MPTPTPSVAELRAVAQPATLFERNSGEHWAGRLYMRRLSPYVTRALLRTGLTPNGATWVMLGVGVAAAAVLTLPGLVPALAALVLIQVQLLFDCVDGEIARWRRRFSPAGIYLDRIAHYLTESALPIALGIRADGGWGSIGGWTTLGLLAAVLALLVKAEGHLIHVARLESGRGKAQDTAEVSSPRGGILRRLRRALRFLPFFRAFVAVEATLLTLAAAVADEFAGALTGTRTLVVALVALGALTVPARLVAVLTSERLR